MSRGLWAPELLQSRHTQLQTPVSSDGGWNVSQSITRSLNNQTKGVEESPPGSGWSPDQGPSGRCPVVWGSLEPVSVCASCDSPACMGMLTVMALPYPPLHAERGRETPCLFFSEDFRTRGTIPRSLTHVCTWLGNKTLSSECVPKTIMGWSY